MYCIYSNGISTIGFGTMWWNIYATIVGASDTMSVRFKGFFYFKKTLV